MGWANMYLKKLKGCKREQKLMQLSDGQISCICKWRMQRMTETPPIYSDEYNTWTKCWNLKMQSTL